jgi:hypothetical protein
MFTAQALFAGIVCGQDDKSPKPSETDPENLRTQTRQGQCSVGVQFEIRIVPPNGSSAGNFETPFAGARQGLDIPTNGHIELGVKNLQVAPLSGSVGFTFFRGPAGDEPIPTPPGTFTIKLSDAKAVSEFDDPKGPKTLKSPQLDAPPGIGPNNTPIAEVLWIVAKYKPDSLPDSCEVADHIAIQWLWNGNLDQGTNWPFFPPNPNHALPPTLSRVDWSPGIIDEKTGFPGHVNKATPTVVLFAVQHPFTCCGKVGRAYAIIQFVRHTWKLGSNPQKSDDWNLDGSEKQSQLHTNGIDYDPTYTNDPAGKSNDLVQVGPWDASGKSSAITVYDFPGLLENQHGAFVKEGGSIKWEFVTLLVCLESPADQNQYLKDGLVQAFSHYTVERIYTAGNPLPVVKVVESKDKPFGPPAYFKICKTLAQVLNDFKLKQPYLNPRAHILKIP